MRCIHRRNLRVEDRRVQGAVPEWTNGAALKADGRKARRFESFLLRRERFQILHFRLQIETGRKSEIPNLQSEILGGVA